MVTGVSTTCERGGSEFRLQAAITARAGGAA